MVLAKHRTISYLRARNDGLVTQAMIIEEQHDQEENKYGPCIGGTWGMIDAGRICGSSSPSMASSYVRSHGETLTHWLVL